MELTKIITKEIRNELYEDDLITNEQFNKIKKSLENAKTREEKSLGILDKYVDTTLIITSKEDRIQAELNRKMNTSSFFDNTVGQNIKLKVLYTTADSKEVDAIDYDEIYIIYKATLKPSITYEICFFSNVILIYHPDFKFEKTDIYVRVF